MSKSTTSSEYIKAALSSLMVAKCALFCESDGSRADYVECKEFAKIVDTLRAFQREHLEKVA